MLNTVKVIQMCALGSTTIVKDKCKTLVNKLI